MEIGGYIEFERYSNLMLHDNAIALNSGRNCLSYLIQARKIHKITLPKFLCDSVGRVCKDLSVKIRYYSIGIDFMPARINLDNDEWLYLVNYYGHLSNSEIMDITRGCDRVIVDNAQAYFQEPISGIDTIYTCRKYFGVPDGAFLYTDCPLERELKQDKSYGRMEHLFGRFESSASEFYMKYRENEDKLSKTPLRQMSKLTFNLLHGINYSQIKTVRKQNFQYLDGKFKEQNKLELTIPEGAFMYPLYINNGFSARKKLQERGVYIPTLWPDVYNFCNELETEYDMAKNILPLPVDQRYTLKNMEILSEEVMRCID